MSKSLGCSDIGTIKNHIEKIKSGVLIKNDIVKTTSEESIVLEDDLFLVEKYKFIFLELLAKHSKMNALLLYRTYPKAYKLVSKHDREWIENKLLKQKPTQGSKSNRLKKYWRDKDKYLYEKLIRSLDKIKAKQELYERITIALLQKYIGYYNLHQNKSKLPKCFKLINVECETIIAYQKRRINYVIKKMEDGGIKITFAKILYKAGLRSKINEEVLSYIKEMMKKEQVMF